MTHWLEDLERKTASLDADLLLWPNTPLENLQGRIRERVGAGDRDVSNPASRPARIIKALRKVKPGSVLDICCGDALVLKAVKDALDVPCYGADLNLGIPGQAEAIAAGVKLYRVALQVLVDSIPPLPFSVTMMLNTYRGWKDAGLHPNEAALPDRVTAWLANHSYRSVLTVSPDQFRELAVVNHVQDIGPGEGDNSRLVLVTWY